MMCRIRISKAFKKETASALFLLLIPLLLSAAARDSHTLSSPDGIISLQITTLPSIEYEVLYNGKSVIYPSAIALHYENAASRQNAAVVVSARTQSIRKEIIPPVKEKRAVIEDHYNELVIEFDDQIWLVFRAYNDGIAYRFESHRSDSITIINEKVTFALEPGATLIYPRVAQRFDADIFHSPFEDPYNYSAIDTLPNEHMIYSPLLVESKEGPYMVITESDVFDYPGLFLMKGERNNLTGQFAGYPLEERLTEGEFRQKLVTRRASYIAKSQGNRTFPWRVIAIEPADAGLLTNDLVYRLARPPKLASFDWIKPGKSTEEWITGLNLYGVDFESGLNTATYLYYIDFAARFGFEYVMLDAGWSDVNDLLAITPEMDMEEITRYATEKGVGLILWTQASTIERQWKAILPIFKRWGIKIIMTDFIDRNDQPAMQFMEWFAAETAKEQFMCMIHGGPVPAGITRTYPNILAREGVLASEYNLWSDKANPNHDLLIPFIRMVSGPMDYEPGLLQNATQAHNTKMGFEKVIAQGTRMHQMAMFVVYESPLQLFAGNISDALREPELMELVGKIPTTWDDTQILDAKLGQHILEVRRHGNDWYVAAMNNWEPVDFQLSLQFLPEGRFWMEMAADGINAAKNPHDYKISYREVTRLDEIAIRLAPGGGFLARLSFRQ